ncbi:hypothetical protein BHE74_00055642 [Ensete ventricosum]|nr:hypothetical protein GW17_00046437 [Ensete ventricosum]RWW39063.1 hypothetical protein BHE74_00055642 [Ensete ventricosum]
MWRGLSSNSCMVITVMVSRSEQSLATGREGQRGVLQPWRPMGAVLRVERLRYPIYHIPTRRSVKDLSVCFLTYHTLSSLFQDETHESLTNDLTSFRAGKNSMKPEEKCDRISLPPFGLATYKLRGSLWTMAGTGDHERITSLLGAAKSWLQQLKVQHHDFTYFTTHFV